MREPAERVRPLPPGGKEGFCVYCGYVATARHEDHVLKALEGHLVYCALERARAAYEATQAPPGVV